MTKQEIQKLKKEIKWLKINMAILLVLLIAFAWIIQKAISDMYEYQSYLANETSRGFKIVGESMQEIIRHFNYIYSILVYGNQTIEGVFGNASINIVIEKCDDYEYELPTKNKFVKEAL